MQCQTGLTCSCAFEICGGLPHIGHGPPHIPDDLRHDVEALLHVRDLPPQGRRIPSPTPSCTTSFPAGKSARSSTITNASASTSTGSRCRPCCSSSFRSRCHCHAAGGLRSLTTAAAAGLPAVARNLRLGALLLILLLALAADAPTFLHKNAQVGNLTAHAVQGRRHTIEAALCILRFMPELGQLVADLVKLPAQLPRVIGKHSRASGHPLPLHCEAHDLLPDMVDLFAHLLCMSHVLQPMLHVLQFAVKLGNLLLQVSSPSCNLSL
mmetsp:Transcript_79494/g.202539  ORF Transcript_79494/g.202539 Transcript_79494/m.202539 type:complete len:267 (-) Transcript_79494:799-1599(-)